MAASEMVSGLHALLEASPRGEFNAAALEPIPERHLTVDELTYLRSLFELLARWDEEEQ